LKRLRLRAADAAQEGWQAIRPQSLRKIRIADRPEVAVQRVGRTVWWTIGVL
jgi:hypothetical protein